MAPLYDCLITQSLINSSRMRTHTHTPPVRCCDSAIVIALADVSLPLLTPWSRRRCQGFWLATSDARPPAAGRPPAGKFGEGRLVASNTSLRRSRGRSEVKVYDTHVTSRCLLVWHLCPVLVSSLQKKKRLRCTSVWPVTRVIMSSTSSCQSHLPDPRRRCSLEVGRILSAIYPTPGGEPILIGSAGSSGQYFERSFLLYQSMKSSWFLPDWDGSNSSYCPVRLNGQYPFSRPVHLGGQYTFIYHFLRMPPLPITAGW